MLLCHLDPLPLDAAEVWAAGTYAAVVQLDRSDEECARLATRIELARCANQTVGRGLTQELRNAWQRVKRADRELERLFAEGLRARSGTLLQGEEQFTYAHVAARLAPRTRWRVSRWRACERCGIVFEARRSARRCPKCKNQRAPRLRPASSWRQCVVCTALFEPADIQQSTCDRCRATKSTRSRNADRPVPPATPYRRATIDVDLILE
jgi:hypothetical protein